jgi:pimeloyl-ACP methyl ester carboxylesterase
MINTFRMPRPIMGIGHSFGGNAITNVALTNPRLFSSVILIDPVINLQEERFAGAYLTPSHLSANRREAWPSRKEAAAAFAKSKFYQSWDPRALDRWVKYGLADKPQRQQQPGSKEVVLATTKHQEVFTFQRPSFHAFGDGGKALLDRDLVPDMNHEAGENASVIPIYRPEPPTTFKRLQHVRPRLLYIFGGTSYMSQPHHREAKMNVTGVGQGGSGGAKMGRVKEVVGEDWGHLIPMEAPAFCAQAASEWAETTMEVWRDEERKYEEWTKRPMVEKSTLSQEVLDRIKPKSKM